MRVWSSYSLNRWAALIVGVVAAVRVEPQQQPYRADFEMTRQTVETHLQKPSTDFQLLLRDTHVLQEEECRLLVLVKIPDALVPELRSYVERPTNGFDRIVAWPGSVILELGPHVRQAGSVDFGVFAEKGGPEYMAWSVMLVPKTIGSHVVKARPVADPPNPRDMKSVTITAEMFWPEHLTRAILLALFVVCFAGLMVVPPIVPSGMLAVVTAFVGWWCLPPHPFWQPSIGIVLPAAVAVYSIVRRESFLEAAFSEYRGPTGSVESGQPASDQGAVSSPAAQIITAVADIAAIRKRSEWIVKASAHRARWQLLVGIATGLAAVLFLLGATVPLGRSIGSEFKSDSVLTVITRGLPYVLCFGCLVVTATFLVRQYRTSLDDVRHFERAQRLRESQAVAVAVAQGLSSPDDVVKKTIEILAWGETSSSGKPKEGEALDVVPKAQ